MVWQFHMEIENIMGNIWRIPFCIGYISIFSSWMYRCWHSKISLCQTYFFGAYDNTNSVRIVWCTIKDMLTVVRWFLKELDIGQIQNQKNKKDIQVCGYYWELDIGQMQNQKNLKEQACKLKATLVSKLWAIQWLTDQC